MIFKLCILSILFLVISGCAQIQQVNFTDVAGNSCQSTHAKPTWYTAETLTTCKVDGKVVAESTSHTDLSLAVGAFGLIATFASVLPALL